MGMNWPDERYVRLYSRDTTTWLMFPWQAKATLPLILRKCDRAGVIDLGDEGIEGLAFTIGLPIEVVEPGVAALMKKGTIRLSDSQLVVPNYIEAQECKQTDAQRKRDERERRRDLSGHSVTKRDNSSQNVTESHTRSHAVTDGHTESHAVTPNRAVPSRAEPSRAVVDQQQPANIADLAPIQFFAWMQSVRAETYQGVLEENRPVGYDGWYLGALKVVGDEERLKAAFRAYVRDPWAKGLRPPGAVQGFIGNGNWRKHVPAAVAPTKRKEPLVPLTPKPSGVPA